jgi:ubiquitin carboxyl-terminal hydrolase 48
MHIASKGDPGPDAQEFYNHVYCEHGNLSPNITNRRKISVKVGSSSLLQSIFLNVNQAVQLLQSIFPSWEPLNGDTETCAICDAEVHVSKEDKKEVRRRIEEEKVILLNVTDIFLLIGCLRPA